MDTYQKLLKQFVRFAGVSTVESSKKEVNNTVKWLRELFVKNHFKVKMVKGYGNPIILARYNVSDKHETALIYGHYDVQPASKEEGWNNDPFTLQTIKGRLIGRGTADNKGQILIHICAAFDLIKKNKLNYNLIFMIEGNEESGSPEIEAFINDNKEKLKADFVMISDGELNGNQPSIEAGYRGGFNCTLTISTAKDDLHSGIYGGIAPSAAHELSTLLAKLYNTDHEINIDGFYDDVDLVDNNVKQRHAKRRFDYNNHYRITGTKALLNEKSIDPYSQVGLRPSIQVTGISSGYQGSGYRNSIPAKATAKINFRLVKSQQASTVMQQFESWVKKNVPIHTGFELNFSDSHAGIKLDLNNVYVKRAAKVLKKTYGSDPGVIYVGGAIPIVTMYSEILKLPCVMVPFANEDCNMHGANENFKISLIKKGLTFSRTFFSRK